MEQKSKKLLIVLFAVVLGFGIFILYSAVYKQTNFTVTDKDKQKLAETAPSEISITGLASEYVLQKEVASKLGLNFAQYFLSGISATDKKKLPSHIDGLFLEAKADTFTDFVGKCVKVTGTINTNWLTDVSTTESTKAGQFTFAGAVFDVKNVSKTDFKNCSPYGKQEISKIDEENTKSGVKFQTFEGVLKREKRVAPDVGAYDYALVLTTPYVDKNNASGLDQKVTLLFLTPATDAVWSTMESNMDEKVTLGGYMNWGYAESKYFLVTKVN